jgi:hypothetical protein
MNSADLRAEQSRLEAEIAALRESIQAAESTLASAEHAARPTPRGFWIGLLVGGAVVATGLACLVVAWLFEFVHFMSHMG